MGSRCNHVPHGVQSTALHIIRKALNLQNDQVRVAQFHAKPIRISEPLLHQLSQANAH